MTRISNANEARPYRSDLRAEQAQETRARILDAALRVMTTGLASLSVPAVAREAGVSVPTVYRHFGTKADLLAEMYPHAARRAGLDRVPDPSTVDDVKSTVRAVIERIDALDDVSRAAYASPIADEVRHATMPSRFARIRRLGESIEPPLSSGELDRITRLLVVLVSQSALRTWRDHLGVSADQAAEDVDWILRAAIAAARSEDAR
ncbi:MAG: TetR/AcrR family transcriptional regulator [Candidatus Limnocylindria bacterium]